MKKYFLVLAIVLEQLISGFAVMGQTIVTYNPGLTTDLSVVSGSSDPNVVGSVISISPGATGYCASYYTGCLYYQITANSIAGQAYCSAATPNITTAPDFFTFNITPIGGKVMHITGISITCGSFGASNSGAKKIMMGYQDGSSSWVASSVIPVSIGNSSCAPMTPLTWSFNLTTSNTVTFKIIPFNATKCNCSTDEFAFNEIVVNGDIPLPVELISFTSQKISNENIVLQWSTASENNSDYFEVEYSEDGKEFISYTKVKSAGNTSAETYYSKNVKGNFGTGTVYFRLKQVDQDGTISYSTIISEKIDPTKNTDDLQVYYNTTQEKIIVRFDLDASEYVNLNLYDLPGRQMVSNSNAYAEGSHEILLDKPVANGVYILEYKSKEHHISKKVIVLD